jgi:hypothetical protein
VLLCAAVQEARFKGMAGEQTVVGKVLLTGNDDHFMVVKTLVRHVRCAHVVSLYCNARTCMCDQREQLFHGRRDARAPRPVRACSGRTPSRLA